VNWTRSPVAIALIACAGCAAKAPAAAPAKPRPAPVAPVLSAGELTDAGWAEVESLRQSLVLRLPQRAAWRVDDQTTWFVARHAASESELRLRTWLAPRLVRAEQCQEQARLWLPSIPPLREEAVVRRALRAPDGFSGEVVVGVEPVSEGLGAHALAFGASVGRCYAAVFTTRASGIGAEDVIGRRLVVIVEGVLERVRRRGIEERVEAVPR
jgi:hypothetical protein